MVAKIFVFFNSWRSFGSFARERSCVVYKQRTKKERMGILINMRHNGSINLFEVEEVLEEVLLVHQVVVKPHPLPSIKSGLALPGIFCRSSPPLHDLHFEVEPIQIIEKVSYRV
jgi:hypothetical protein